MLTISHRGNLNGPDANRDNRVWAIREAISLGFDVEIDVWYKDNQLFIGHDEPKEIIYIDFLKNNRFWCHAKNVESLEYMLDNNIHCFWHENDDRTLTSLGYIWTHPLSSVCSRSILVHPERKYGFDFVPECYAICTDYPLLYGAKL